MKKTKKHFFINIIQWVFATVLAFGVVNFAVFPYYHMAGWISRDNSSTNAIWNPGDWIIRGTEGYGLYKVDKYGYLNDDIERQDDYILCVGSSFTQGKEVPKGCRYSDILNDALADSDNRLAVYNCSIDDFRFTKIVSHFYAITQEFGDASTIILEIGNLEYDTKSILDSLNQCNYDPKNTGDKIITNMSYKSKAVLKAKSLLPIYSVLDSQIEAFKSTSRKSSDTPNSEKIFYDEENRNALDAALKLIRSEYDGRLMIVYHPDTYISSEGKLIIDNKPEAEWFNELCEENDIEFVDVTQYFERYYESDFSVPYGFSNTRMSEGHLNKSGHKAVAEALLDAIEMGEE